MRYFTPPAKLLFILTLLFSSLGTPAQAAPRELHFLSWSEYIDPQVVKEFEQSFNAKIKFRYFEDDDDRDAILVKSAGKGYDLVILNGVQVKTYRKHGWLSRLEPQKIPNLQYIDPKWTNAFKSTQGYSVPYFWGTIGIAYRKDLVQGPISSWSQLFKPSAEKHGKIVMLGVGRDVIGMALKSIGESTNSTDLQALKKVEHLLKQQQPYVKTYAYMTLDKKSPLVTGEAVIAMAFSGDALMVKEHNDNIEYVVPKEGGNLWVDQLAVLQGSKNKDLAWQFINFMNEPKIAARNAAFVNYATPNTAGEKLLPAEFLQNKVIYPGKAQLDKSEFDGELPIRIIKKRNEIMAGLRHR